MDEAKTKALMGELGVDEKSDVYNRAIVHARIYTESDRGAVLIGVSYIDDSLQRVIKNAMFTLDESLFNGSGAPLSSLSAKVKLARSFGIISDNLANNLHILRKVRNQIAHSWGNVDFSASPYVDWIQSLGYLKTTSVHPTDSTAFPDIQDVLLAIGPREYLLHIIHLALAHLDMLAADVKPIPCRKRNWIDFARDDAEESQKWIELIVKIQKGEIRNPRTWFHKPPED